MAILVTGVAGFIGFHTARYFLNTGHHVIGIDHLSNYYDVSLKKSRLAHLKGLFHFYQEDITNRQKMADIVAAHPTIDRVVHLAAQAGVRYSLENPYAYEQANVLGWITLLEACRALPLYHMIYASSSSVYGANQKLPFSVQDPVDHPISLYAATKRCNELCAEVYAHLYQMPLTGLRFFTVYGPWGRPDMAAFIFTKAILEGQPLPVFNHGNMRRNFTYIDDVVQGIAACLEKPSAGHRLYNIGNDQSENLVDFIHVLEKHLGRTAHMDLQDMQAGDVPETIADIQSSAMDFGFSPKTDMDQGLHHFVSWYKEFYHV